MARVRLSRDAIAFLSSLPQKQAQQIAKRIDGLEAEPPKVLIEKLSGHHTLFKVAAWEYRIAVERDAGMRNVLHIGKRNDASIYRRLNRLKS